MTTILILQMRNLRFKYFPKFTLLVLAELVCSNSDPLASTPHHPPSPNYLAHHLPVPWAQQETVVDPLGQVLLPGAGSHPVLFSWFGKKVMWRRFVYCVLSSPLSDLVPSLDLARSSWGQVGSTSHLILIVPLA